MGHSQLPRLVLFPMCQMGASVLTLPLPHPSPVPHPFIPDCFCHDLMQPLYETFKIKVRDR